METFLFAATADWHLARSAWARSGIDGDAAFGLAQVVDYCVDRGCDLIAAGDLFDTREPPPEAVAAAREQLDRLRWAGLRVAYVQGQHERAETPWLAAIHDGPEPAAAAAAFPAPARGLVLHGIDWQPQPRLAAALSAVPPGCEVLVCHQVWAELMGTKGAAEGSLADVPPQVALVVTGDYHAHRRLDVVRPDGSRLAVLSPGPLAMQSTDEEPDKAFWVVGLDAEGNVVAESVPLRSRPFRRVALASPAELDAFCGAGLPGLEADAAAEAERSRLPAHLRRPILRVDYDPDAVPGARPRLEAACRGRFHLFPMPRAAAAARGDDADADAARAARARTLAALRDRGPAGVLEALDLSDLPDPEQARRDALALVAARDWRPVLDAIAAGR